MNLQVNERTLSNYDKRLGFKSYKQAIRPLITPLQRQKRVDWCRKFSSWTENQWRRVLWTDESSIEINISYSNRVWRKRGDRYKDGLYKLSKMIFVKKYLKF